MTGFSGVRIVRAGRPSDGFCVLVTNSRSVCGRRLCEEEDGIFGPSLWRAAGDDSGGGTVRVRAGAEAEEFE